MVGWPLYAEQELNCLVLVEEMKLGIAVDKSDGLVTAEEVERVIGELMNSAEGEAMRKRSAAAKAMASAAWEACGSSLNNFSGLVGSWKQ
ncbi:unnamed protein product, partial [Ilex paraguariensis]